MQNLTVESIQQAVANEINEALETINGPLVTPSNVAVDLTTMTVTVKFFVNHVPADNYIGLCYY